MFRGKRTERDKFFELRVIADRGQRRVAGDPLLKKGRSLPRRQHPERLPNALQGALAVVGRGRAVCQVRGIELWGPPAFLTYLGVHLYYLGGLGGRRLEVIMAWATMGLGALQSRVIEGELPSEEPGGRAEPGALAATGGSGSA